MNHQPVTNPPITAAGKPRSKRGRKDLRNNPDIVRGLEKSLLAGMSQKAACEYVMISVSTFCRWMAEGETAPKGSKSREFLECMEKAKSEAIHRNLLQIQRAAAKDWRAAAWFLERRYPEDWSLKRRLKNSTPCPEPNQAPKSMTAPEAEKLEAKLMRIYAHRSKNRQTK